MRVSSIRRNELSDAITRCLYIITMLEGQTTEPDALDRALNDVLLGTGWVNGAELVEHDPVLPWSATYDNALKFAKSLFPQRSPVTIPIQLATKTVYRSYFEDPDPFESRYVTTNKTNSLLYVTIKLYMLGVTSILREYEISD